MIRKADGKKLPVIDGKLVAHLDRCGRLIRRAHIAVVATVFFLLASLCAVYVTLSGVFVGVAAYYLLYVDGFFAAATVISAGLVFWWFRKARKNRVGVEMIKIRYQPGGKSEEFIIIFPADGKPPIEVPFVEFKKLGGRHKIPPVCYYRAPGKTTVIASWKFSVIEMECFVFICEDASPAALFRFCPKPLKGAGFVEQMELVLGEWLSNKCSACNDEKRVWKRLEAVGECLKHNKYIPFRCGFSIEVKVRKILMDGRMVWSDDIIIRISKKALRDILRPGNLWQQRAKKRLPMGRIELVEDDDVKKRVHSALR